MLCLCTRPICLPRSSPPMLAALNYDSEHVLPHIHPMKKKMFRGEEWVLHYGFIILLGVYMLDSLVPKKEVESYSSTQHECSHKNAK